MKIYTKTGDAGDTGLYGGKRRSKADLRVQAYGEVDELQAALGLVRAVGVGKQGLQDALRAIQEDCFVLSCELARTELKPTRKDPVLSNTRVDWLEVNIDKVESNLPELKHFILQGGGELGSRLFLARAICRRAERAVVQLSGVEKISPVVLVYLNRLSDLLFVFARFANQEEGITEEAWLP